VIPKSIGIGGGALYESMGQTEDPPLPSKIVVLRVASGGTVCTGASGDEGVAGNENGVGGGKQKSTRSPHSWKDIMPARTSIIIPAAARNGLPKITGAWKLSSISKTMKSHGMTKFPT